MTINDGDANNISNNKEEEKENVDNDTTMESKKKCYDEREREQGGRGENNNQSSTSNLLPILIIPGFMSSGLEVKESELRRDWEGKRIWLNLSSLGMSAIYFGKAQQQQQVTAAVKNNKDTAANHHHDDDDNNDDDDDDKEEEEEATKQNKYKSTWLEHMRLNPNDLITEPKGVNIRPIKGLEGVDYLTPGMFTNQVSYVFGPVIEALKKAGYTEGVNLQASPYDWRLPPSQLEHRDGYFSNTMSMVEDLFKKNGQTPVVLLGHSLGCKTAHYFLNFCRQQRKKGGQQWLDKYIHTYLPVGAPHLGAPKALRSYIAGDKMSLDTFLSDEEALVLGRSFGSGPWLFPKELPKGVPSSVYVMPHGVLQISCDYAVSTFDLVNQRHDRSRPNKYKLIVVFGSEGRHVSTKFQPAVSGEEDDSVFFKEQISFATDANPRALGERAVQFVLQEPGIAAAKHEKTTKKSPNKILCFLEFITCLWVVELAYKMIRCVICGFVQTVVLSWDAISASVGGGTTLAFSEPIIIPNEVWKGEEIDMEVKLYHKDDYGKRDGCLCFAKLRQPRNAILKVKMKWLSYNRQQSFKPICSPISLPYPDGGKESLNIMRELTSYQEFPGYDILEREGLTHTLRMVKEVLDDDDLGPRTLSSSEKPPVKRVHAIYGVNLQTEIGGIYKRKDTRLLEDELKNLYELDKKANMVDKDSGYIVKNGLLFETIHTKQAVANDRTICGDGTVPYWSLSHCKTWHSSSCKVPVVELPKAEHREILADPRFHTELVNYCRNNEKKRQQELMPMSKLHVQHNSMV